MLKNVYAHSVKESHSMYHKITFTDNLLMNISLDFAITIIFIQ